MRGGGKVNYTSGSLARAKSKSKSKAKSTPTSPTEQKAAALFPQKILLLTPLRKKVKTEMNLDLEEPTLIQSSPGYKCKEVMTREDWMRESDFQYARLAVVENHKEDEGGKGWWVGFEGDKAGRVYQAEVESVMKGMREGDERMRGDKKMSAGMNSAKPGGNKADGLFSRNDCLDIPHWLRYLPRHQAQVDNPETPRRN